MTTRRELLIAFGVGALAAPLTSVAQKSISKRYSIGVLSAESASDQSEKIRIAALRSGLQELGYEESRNIAMVFRWAEGIYGRLPAIATELARLKPDLLVTLGIKATVAARQATSTIPIVVPATGSDLVAMGLATSLARPGGNVTGSAVFGMEIMTKRLEFLKDALPRITRVAVLLNPDNPQFRITSDAMDTAARTLKLSLEVLRVRTPSEIEIVVGALAKTRIDAMVVWEDTMFAANDRLIADLLIRNRIPSIGGKEYAEAGGPIGYGVDRVKLFRQAGVYIDKILKGANPGDLPIDRATTFEFVVNNKVVKALGLNIPQIILVRANRVIE